jgi:hypothetical protein
MLLTKHYQNQIQFSGNLITCEAKQSDQVISDSYFSVAGNNLKKIAPVQGRTPCGIPADSNE